MIDCFWTTAATGNLRVGMAISTLERLKGDDAINLLVLRTPGAWLEPKDIRFTTLACTDTEFQVERRREAENMAMTDIYVLADDDCMPIGLNFFEKGVKVMEGHPEFAILSAWPSNAVIHPWTPEEGTAFEDEDVMEHVSVGGIRFCRKGAMKKWPKAHGAFYDREQADYLRGEGWSVGLMRQVRMNHFGESYSTVWSQELVS